MRQTLWVIWVAMFATGCTTHVAPPAVVEHPVTVYIVDFGRHSDLVVPAEEGRTMTEYSFGDWWWFAEGHTDLMAGIHAIFFSDQSALGRRNLSDPHNEQQLKEMLKAVSLTGVRVERSAKEHLVQDLDERYNRKIQTQIFNADYRTYFVKDDEHYWLFNNSNMMTARWLRELGCKTQGLALLSHFVVDAPTTQPLAAGIP